MQLDVEAKELGVKLQLQTAQGCCFTSEKGGKKELLCCEEMLYPVSMEKCHT